MMQINDSLRLAHHPTSYNCQIMSTSPLPLPPDFASVEEAEAYDRWFRAKVQKSLEDQRPLTAHDEVMKKLRQVIEKHPPHASDPVER